MCVTEVEKTIFLGRDVTVRTSLDRPGDSLVITFTSRRQGPKIDRAGFGADFFAKRGIPAVHFVSLRNHWWQTAEMEAALQAVENLDLRSRFSGITAYGSSMGGHGALIFSERLQADRVLAFSPQFALHGRNASWNSVWAKETEDLTELYRLEDGCSQVANILVVVDPTRKFDMVHVNAIQSHRDIRVLRIPFGAHPPMRYLNDQRLLAPLAEGMVFGTFNFQKFRHLVRSDRRRNLRYLLGIARRLHRRKSTTGTQSILKTAISEIKHRIAAGEPITTPADAATLITMAYSRKTLDLEGALSLIEQLSALFPTVSHIHAAHAQLLLQSPNPTTAVASAKRALKLNRKNLELRLGLAHTLFAVGRIEEGRDTVLAALNIPERNITTWRRFLSIHAPYLDNATFQSVQQRIQ